MLERQEKEATDAAAKNRQIVEELTALFKPLAQRLTLDVEPAATFSLHETVKRPE